MRQLTGARLFSALLMAMALGFIVLNIWAYRQTGVNSVSDLISGPLSALDEQIPADRWVTVVASDLFMGWVIAAAAIWSLEYRHSTALAWIVGVFCIGNLVTACYVLARREQLTGAIEAIAAARLFEARREPIDGH